MSIEPGRPRIDTALVRDLVSRQFPAWAGLGIEAIEPQGHDNRTFRLGDDKGVRLPSASAYAPHVAAEYHWLPKLAAQLPLAIPRPLGLGVPDRGYPWHWSVNSWLGGTDAARGRISDPVRFAIELAGFLKHLQAVDAAGAPVPGADNFYRGGCLAVYDSEVRDCIDGLPRAIDAGAVAEIWQQALHSQWRFSPVWVHGDIAPGNLLVEDGRLCGVIDFGQLAAGDPACDLAIAWTFLNEESREAFRNRLDLDEGTWVRGAGWALWKALLVLNVNRDDVEEREEAARVVREIVTAFG